MFLWAKNSGIKVNGMYLIYLPAGVCIGGGNTSSLPNVRTGEEVAEIMRKMANTHSAYSWNPNSKTIWEHHPGKKEGKWSFGNNKEWLFLWADKIVGSASTSAPANNGH